MKNIIIAVVTVLSLSSVAQAADKPVTPAGAKCAVAKSTVIDADGTIHIKTIKVCK